MARSSWTGSIIFAGFPIPVSAYNLVASPAKLSFKTLCKCHGQPIKQQNTCSVDGTVVTDGDKGIEHGKNAYYALSEAAMASIQGVKSVAVEPERICPLDTLDLHMSTGAYALVPGQGADKSVAILWRSLGKTNRAIISRWTMRSGSRDSIVAIYAGPDGLVANTLPYAAQRNVIPASSVPSIAVSDAELAMFEQAMTTLYTNERFDPAAFKSDFIEKRQAAIDAVVAGKAPATATAAAPAPAVPDLMAALQATLAQAKTTGKEPVAA